MFQVRQRSLDPCHATSCQRTGSRVLIPDPLRQNLHVNELFTVRKCGHRTGVLGTGHMLDPPAEPGHPHRQGSPWSDQSESLRQVTLICSQTFHPEEAWRDSHGALFLADTTCLRTGLVTAPGNQLVPCLVSTSTPRAAHAVPTQPHPYPSPPQRGPRLECSPLCHEDTALPLQTFPPLH